MIPKEVNKMAENIKEFKFHVNFNKWKYPQLGEVIYQAQEEARKDQDTNPPPVFAKPWHFNKDKGHWVKIVVYVNRDRDDIKNYYMTTKYLTCDEQPQEAIEEQQRKDDWKAKQQGGQPEAKTGGSVLDREPIREKLSKDSFFDDGDF